MTDLEILELLRRFVYGPRILTAGQEHECMCFLNREIRRLSRETDLRDEG